MPICTTIGWFYSAVKQMKDRRAPVNANDADWAIGLFVLQQDVAPQNGGSDAT
jgi:hypothetical protein